MFESTHQTTSNNALLAWKESFFLTFSIRRDVSPQTSNFRFIKSRSRQRHLRYRIWIFSKRSTWPIGQHQQPLQSREDRGIIAMKVYSTLCRIPKIEHHHWCILLWFPRKISFDGCLILVQWIFSVYSKLCQVGSVHMKTLGNKRKALHLKIQTTVINIFKNIFLITYRRNNFFVTYRKNNVVDI